MSDVTRLLDRLLVALPELPEASPEDLEGGWAAAADRRRWDTMVVRRCRLGMHRAAFVLLVEPGPLVDGRARWLDLCPPCRRQIEHLLRDAWPGDDAVLRRFHQLQDLGRAG